MPLYPGRVAAKARTPALCFQHQALKLGVPALSLDELEWMDLGPDIAGQERRGAEQFPSCYLSISLYLSEPWNNICR